MTEIKPDETQSDDTDESATNKIRMSVVKKWDLKDRGDGIQLRVQFRDGTKRKVTFSDEDAKGLSDALCRITSTRDEERPVTEGNYVR